MSFLLLHSRSFISYEFGLEFAYLKHNNALKHHLYQRVIIDLFICTHMCAPIDVSQRLMQNLIRAVLCGSRLFNRRLMLGFVLQNIYFSAVDVKQFVAQNHLIDLQFQTFQREG